MALPPLPPGAKMIGGGGPSRNPDLFRSLLDSGAVATNGYRTPADIQRLRAQGYKPASNSLHLDGDALDLTPGKSGLSMAQLEARARQIASGWDGAKVLNEGHHVHVQLPGWGMAPGTPGTPNSGLPPLPQGAKLVQRGSLQATGKVHDGDTFATNRGNARLFGIDAFELNQQGRRSDGSFVSLGANARNALMPFAQPDASVTSTGAMTYGRPVVTLDRNGDAGNALLSQGWALTDPRYLRADQSRFNDYTQTERLARLNRRGAHATTYVPPSANRDGAKEPWQTGQSAEYGSAGSAVVFGDEPTPFGGLKPEVAQGYVSIWQDMNSRPEDLLAYAKENGFGQYLDPASVRASYADRAKTGNPSAAISYLKAPRIMTDGGGGGWGSFARGALDPVNMADEMWALGAAGGLHPGRENVWNSDRRFGDILGNNLDQNRSILDYDEANHPYARLGGQLATAVALPYGAGARTPMAVARIGAAEGALAGFGAGENLRDRAIGAGLGAVAGGAGGAFLGRAGQEIVESGIGSKILNRLGVKRPADVAGEAAPILNDGLQNAGPTPAARSQPTAAMDDLPAVRFGPAVRERDYLNVGGMPPLPPGAQLIDDLDGARPMGERLDASTMAQLFEGADPQALLPRPGNVVSSFDEALAANPGSFERLTAPDEFSALSVRRLPSNNDMFKSQSVRGPLDMTQALRRLGGIQDQGGELSHLGIGKPRKLPFGGGEQFLGRLINNESGMPLDEATHKLWEMGYFPEFRDRPTPADLLDRLREEANGTNRFFHPDDAGEVANFEGLQAERYALAEQEAVRGPIYERSGSEIGFDDLVANTPPASAYEEMPRLTGKVGNLNLDKIERPEDVGQILDYVASRVGGFDAAARGRVTNEETARLAADLGMTPETLLKRRQGQALNAEQAFAARNLMRGSLEEVGRLAKRAVGGDDKAKLALEKALLKHTAIQEQVAGATAEAGRALQQFKMVSGVERAQAKAIREFLKGTKEDSLQDAASAILDLMEDPAKANRFIADATKPKLKDKMVELYYNSLLSGPRTHAVNVVSNFATALGSLPEHGAAWALGGIRAGANKLLGRDTAERILGGELGARTVGLMQGAIDGLQAARYTFKTGKVPDLMSKVEAAQHEAIGGKLGPILRTPTRALSAEDEFFKAMARRSELASLAYRKAKGEGLSGDAFKVRVSELVDNPPEEMLAQALDFARYQTFQRPVGDIAGGVMKAANSHPLLKLVVPFVRTPTNIMKYAAERSPAAPLLKEWRADFLAGGARRDLAVSRAMLGSGLGLYVMSLAAEGKITGGGPLDENAKGIMRADGWQPYSIKMGDKWVSYQRLDPLAMTLGIAADYVEKQSVMTDRQREEQASLVVASVIQNLSDKTWLTGLSEALGAIQDPVRYGPGAIRRTAAGIAVPAAVSQVASTLDESPREAKTVGEAIQARIPGLSDNLRPSLDAWGQPIVREGALGPDIASSFMESTPRNSPVNQEALRLGVTVSKPSRDFGEHRLSDDEFHALRMKAGDLTVQGFGALIASPVYRLMTDDQRRKAFDKIKREARKAAKEELFGGAAATPKTDPPSLPKGATIPPLPPGANLIQGN